jgi:hypothetical protein
MRLVLIAALALAACGRYVDGPYQSCDDSTDRCDHGLSCSPTSLPVSTGYTGELCTAGCNVDSDCPSLIDNYDAICVNQQCYTQCPTGSDTCPYGTDCLQIDDDQGETLRICSP